MPKIFCPNCYTANSYTDRPGKCCHECGKPFLESSASIPSQNIPVRKPIIEEPPKKIRTPKTLKGVRTRVDDDEYENEQEVEIDDDGEIELEGELDIELEGLGELEGELDGELETDEEAEPPNTHPKVPPVVKL